jgi:hypothetical protein
MVTTERQQNMKNDEISLKEVILKINEFWRYFLSKWGIILIFGLLGASLGLVYALIKKPVYTATTTFVLEDDKGVGGLGNLAGLASMAGVDIGGGGSIFQGDNILELYKSRKMLLQTLLTDVPINGKKQSLATRYIEFNELRKSWDKQPELLKLQFLSDSLQNGNPYLKPNRARDSIFTIIVTDISKNYLNVTKQDKQSSIIKVDVKSKDEFFAKAFNEQIVKNVNGFYLQTKIRKSLENVQIMQRKTDSVRSVMNGSIYTAVQVSDATPNLNPTRQVQKIAPAQKAQFSAETNKTILGTLVQNLEMSKVALMKETPLLEVIDQPVYPLTKEKVGIVKAVVIGAFLFGFLTIVFLLFKKVFKGIMER